MNNIDLKHITKKQLIDVINEQRAIIDNHDEILKISETKSRMLQNELDDNFITIKSLKTMIARNEIDSIADYKMFQKFIEIFRDEAMTHNEKRYFARKIQHVFGSAINTKLQNVDFERLDLPF